MDRHLVTLHALAGGERAEEGRSQLAQVLDADVGAPDEGGMLELEVSAPSRERALERVRDAIAAAGLEERFTFPAQTGTDFDPPGRRAAPPDERPDEEEPPHLERGSPREDEPAPYDPPPPEVP
jgi:hypothetical protein